MLPSSIQALRGGRGRHSVERNAGSWIVTFPSFASPLSSNQGDSAHQGTNSAGQLAVLDRAWRIRMDQIPKRVLLPQ